MAVDYRNMTQQPSGPRRLTSLLQRPPRGYLSEGEAERAWTRICNKQLSFATTPIPCAVKMRIEKRGAYHVIIGRVHPACEHYRRALEDGEVEYELGTKDEEWQTHSLTEFEKQEQHRRMINGSDLGRYWA